MPLSPFSCLPASISSFSRIIPSLPASLLLYHTLFTDLPLDLTFNSTCSTYHAIHMTSIPHCHLFPTYTMPLSSPCDGRRVGTAHRRTRTHLTLHLAHLFATCSFPALSAPCHTRAPHTHTRATLHTAAMKDVNSICQNATCTCFAPRTACLAQRTAPKRAGIKRGGRRWRQLKARRSAPTYARYAPSTSP